MFHCRRITSCNNWRGSQHQTSDRGFHFVVQPPT